MNVRRNVPKYVNFIALTMTTASALFASASAAVTTREPKTANNLLTVQNICKPNSIQTLMFGLAVSKTAKSEGKKFMFFQVTPDQYVTDREAKVSLVDTCELQDHLSEGLEKLAPIGVPHLSLVVLASRGNAASTGQTETAIPVLDKEVGQEDSAINEEDVAVSQQEITAALKDKTRKSSSRYKNIEIIYARNEDHWQLDYSGATPKKKVSDARPVLVQLIEQHHIEITKRTWAFADNIYFAIMGVIYPPTDERLAAADEAPFSLTSKLISFNAAIEANPAWDSPAQKTASTDGENAVVALPIWMREAAAAYGIWKNSAATGQPIHLATVVMPGELEPELPLFSDRTFTQSNPAPGEMPTFKASETFLNQWFVEAANAYTAMNRPQSSLPSSAPFSDINFYPSLTQGIFDRLAIEQYLEKGHAAPAQPERPVAAPVQPERPVAPNQIMPDITASERYNFMPLKALDHR